MKHILSMATALALSVSASAQTTSFATATLSDFKVQLIDLDPNDGITPWIDFNTIVGSETTAKPWQTYGAGGDTHDSGSAFGDTSATYNGSSASISGDINSGLTATATSSVAGTGSAEAHALLGEKGEFTGFTMSANTELVITGTALMSAYTDPNQSLTDASASWEVQLSGLGGTYSFTNDIHEAINAGSFGNYYEGNYGSAGGGTNGFTVSLTNDTTNSTTGTFYGVVDTMVLVSSMSFGDPAAVPEASNIALMLAGLGAIALSLYKRRD